MVFKFNHYPINIECCLLFTSAAANIQVHFRQDLKETLRTYCKQYEPRTDCSLGNNMNPDQIAPEGAI